MSQVVFTLTEDGVTIQLSKWYSEGKAVYSLRFGTQQMNAQGGPSYLANFIGADIGMDVLVSLWGKAKAAQIEDMAKDEAIEKKRLSLLAGKGPAMKTRVTGKTERKKSRLQERKDLAAKRV